MMTPSLEVQLILCDAAQADPTTGKMHMLGAGWSRIVAEVPHAVAVLIKVPWDRSDQKLPLILELRNEAGEPVEVSTPAGEEPVRSDGYAQVARPPEALPGTTFDASFALNISPLPLPPGKYRWYLQLAEFESSIDFTVLPINTSN